MFDFLQSTQDPYEIQRRQQMAELMMQNARPQGGTSGLAAIAQGLTGVLGGLAYGGVARDTSNYLRAQEQKKAALNAALGDALAGGDMSKLASSFAAAGDISHAFDAMKFSSDQSKLPPEVFGKYTPASISAFQRSHDPAALIENPDKGSKPSLPEGYTLVDGKAQIIPGLESFVAKKLGGSGEPKGELAQKLAILQAAGIKLGPDELKSLAGLKMPSDREDKAPTGYRYRPDGSLEAIPGGPATKPPGVSAENLTKLGLLDAAQASLDTFMKHAVDSNGVPSRTAAVAGPAKSALDEAISNVMRVESGAAIGKEEMDQARARYGVGLLGRDETNRYNLKQLQRKIADMRSAISGAQPKSDQQVAAQELQSKAAAIHVDAIPITARQALKAHPDRKAEFDAKFGAGAADAVLNG